MTRNVDDYVYEIESLRQIIEGFSEIDSFDSFEVLALFFLLGVECFECGTHADFSKVESPLGSSEWCRSAAKVLRDKEWYIPKFDEERTYTLIATCSDCMKTRINPTNK